MLLLLLPLRPAYDGRGGQMARPTLDLVSLNPAYLNLLPVFAS